MKITKELFDEIKNKTDKDLEKMLFEIDLWNPTVISEVEKELKLRNKFPLDYDEKIRMLKENENRILENGIPGSIFGKIIACIGVFGFIGIFLGLNYKSSKIKSRYTEIEYFKYDQKTREFGNYIYFISLILTVFGILSKLN